MSVTTGIPRDVLRAQQKAVAERKRRHREAALSSGVDWRPFAYASATVTCPADRVGVSRPREQCELVDGVWTYVGDEAELEGSTP